MGLDVGGKEDTKKKEEKISHTCMCESIGEIQFYGKPRVARVLAAPVSEV